MIAAHSLWTSPGRAHPRALLMLGLSASLLARQFHKVVLITDKEGAELVRDLSLPYTEIVTILDEIPAGAGHVWATGKLRAYAHLARAGQPFIHFDHDSFLFQPLPEQILTAPVCAQSPEYWMGGQATHYPVELFTQEAHWLPHGWRSALHADAVQKAYNAGLLGGCDTELLLEYALAGQDVVLHPDNNYFHRLNGWIPSVFIEQFGLRFYAEHYATPVRTLWETPGEDSERTGFYHLSGGRKGDPQNLERVIGWAKEVCPDLWERLR